MDINIVDIDWFIPTVLLYTQNMNIYYLLLRWSSMSEVAIGKKARELVVSYN